jgi:hypothetical protein
LCRHEAFSRQAPQTLPRLPDRALPQGRRAAPRETAVFSADECSSRRGPSRDLGVCLPAMVRRFKSQSARPDTYRKRTSAAQAWMPAPEHRVTST